MRLDSSHTIVKMPTRRGSAPRFALPLLMVAAASWLAGCATMAPKPKSASDLDQPHLVLRLGERRLYLKEGGVAQPPEGFLVAVGKPQYPTPVGRFSINEMVVNPDFTVKDVDEAVRIARDTQYGLHASVFTRDITKAFRVARALPCGTASVNAFSEGDVKTPFGGYKRSGSLARDNGAEAMDQYMQTKTIWVNLN
jgi:hypothetical protein